MIVVIEGLDGCGKETQSRLLEEKFISFNKNVHRISFPRYGKKGAELAESYLHGQFGKANEVSPYMASICFAIDRVAAYKDEILPNISDDFILDRYVESNLLYQAVKLSGEERDNFINWVLSFEYGQLGLPKPDKVIFLNVDRDVQKSLLAKRGNAKHDGKDIHESDDSFMDSVRSVSLSIAEKLGWTIINCCENGKMKSADAISDEIWNSL